MCTEFVLLGFALTQLLKVHLFAYAELKFNENLDDFRFKEPNWDLLKIVMEKDYPDIDFKTHWQPVQTTFLQVTEQLNVYVCVCVRIAGDKASCHVAFTASL